MLNKDKIIKIYKNKIYFKKHKINNEIKNYKIKLINNINKNKNIILTKEALKIAKNLNLDLVEINPNFNPPICKIFDYGKYIYKKNKNNKKNINNKKIQIKEIKFKFNTDKNDYNIKINNIIKFIKKKYKVKISIILRGREIIHKNLAINMLNNIKKKINNNKTILIKEIIKNRQISMILIPKK